MSDGNGAGDERCAPLHRVHHCLDNCGAMHWLPRPTASAMRQQQDVANCTETVRTGHDSS